MKVESLIFDMDGTLWDSAANVAASWSEVLERQADVDMKVTEADIKSVMGMPMDAIADKLFGAYSEDRMTQLIDACGDYENEYLREHGGVLYDGVEDTIAKLSGSHRLFIVSNCQSGYIEAFLDYYGFGKYFKDILCWGRYKGIKGREYKDTHGEEWNRGCRICRRHPGRLRQCQICRDKVHSRGIRVWQCEG